MKKLTQVLTIAAIAALFAPASALAQSSGNFTARVNTTQCTINSVGGATGGSLSGGIVTPMLDTTIKTPNSQFTTLLIRPSLVTGLFTNTAVTQDMTSSAQTAAVVVFVTLDGQPVAPQTSEHRGIIYDQRFQQLSADFFSHIATCSATNECSIDLVLSTLAAHSFDFVAPNVGGGTHSLNVRWEFQCKDNAGNPEDCNTTFMANTAGACAGPGTVTVTQTKAFSQSGGVVIQ